MPAPAVPDSAITRNDPPATATRPRPVLPAARRWREITERMADAPLPSGPRQWSNHQAWVSHESMARQPPSAWLGRVTPECAQGRENPTGFVSPAAALGVPKAEIRIGNPVAYA